jgi:hypothetical protein
VKSEPQLVRVQTPAPLVKPNLAPVAPPKPAIAPQTPALLVTMQLSQRIALSVAAGLLTLLVALWIGARRD